MDYGHCILVHNASRLSIGGALPVHPTPSKQTRTANTLIMVLLLNVFVKSCKIDPPKNRAVGYLINSENEIYPIFDNIKRFYQQKSLGIGEIVGWLAEVAA